ncbi:SH3 domain-containing protein [Rhizobium halophytocola]|uniref:SH3 domain-containing protein n=1 Tax=Rhizobium halophytocola TaxID=735519 RepID=A0ABS4E013_9HYPH|nr:SH3 domain-containing protein [Rhizobium halophytocola]MBP1851263.1 hypothetical protein [Rhizobium halophytocola]
MVEQAPRRYRVIETWDVSYPDPIALAIGDRVSLTGREDLWDGHRWLWARGPSGKEGWIPDAVLVDSAGSFRASRAFNAQELGCRPGMVLDGLEALHGWVWCRNADGACGWVPRRNLAAMPSSPSS